MINTDGRLDNNKLNQKQIEVSGSLNVHLPLLQKKQITKIITIYRTFLIELKTIIMINLINTTNNNQ